MDLFNLWSLFILLSAVGFCNGQSVLPAGPLEGVQGKDVTFETIIIPTDVGNFITVSWNFNGGTGLVPVVTSAPNGETVGAGYAGRVTLNSSTGELKLGSLTAKDGGDYAVTMVTNAAVQRTGATLLRVLEPVSAVTITSNLNEAVEFNSTVVLTCSAKGSFLMYKWLNGTAPLVTDGKHVTLSANSTVLTVAGVFRKDLVGPIYCTAFNNLESGNSAPFNLTVTYGPENITMTVTPTAEVKKKGSNITLTCSAQSSPAAVLQWIHNGVPLNVMGPKLVLDNVAVAQSGNYSCMASNAKTLRYLESTTAKFTVVEAISGTKITGPNGTLVAGNSTATLSCQATAGTADTRVWLKNGVALSPSNRVVVSADKSLVTIKPVQKEDSGEYQCKLTNAVSTDSASLKIVISFGPETVSVKGVSAVKVTEPVILKCAAASLPAATYTWKFNGTLIGVMTAEYVIDAAVDKNSGIYTCEASNAVTGLSTSVSHKLSVKEEGTLDDGLTGGQIAGIVIGVLIAIVILIAGVRYMRRKKPPFIRCLRHHEPSEPPPHPLTARCLRLCTLLDCILPGRPLLPGDMERICVCTTYSHYWCPPGLGSRPSPLLSIHQVIRLRHILTWSLLSILCG